MKYNVCILKIVAQKSGTNVISFNCSFYMMLCIVLLQCSLLTIICRIKEDCMKSR